MDSICTPEGALTSVSKVLLLSGWKNSLKGHWQTEWEQLHQDQRVVQHDWHHPKRGDWLASFQDQLLAHEETVTWVLVAHSLGCHLVSAWVAFAPVTLTRRVRGALLVAPPDLTRPDLPVPLRGWRPPVLKQLPFASRLVASDNDPYASVQASWDMAQVWGSEWTLIREAGHLNAESGLGQWPQARAWVASWTKEPK